MAQKRTHIAAVLLCLLLVSANVSAGTITGTIQYANSSQTLNNGTLTFSLSQAAFISGTGAVITSPVYCYTSSAGQVVGLPASTQMF
jgi:hypothetical protein